MQARWRLGAVDTTVVAAMVLVLAVVCLLLVAMAMVLAVPGGQVTCLWTGGVNMAL